MDKSMVSIFSATGSIKSLEVWIVLSRPLRTVRGSLWSTSARVWCWVPTCSVGGNVWA